MLSLLAAGAQEVRAEVPWEVAEPITSGEPVVVMQSPNGVPWETGDFQFNRPGCQSCDDEWGDACDRGCRCRLGPPISPAVFFRAEALMLAQDLNRENFALRFPGLDPVLTTEDLSIPLEGGIRAVGGVRFGEFYRLEGLYFGHYEWSDTAAVRHQLANLIVPLNNVGPGDVIAGNNLVSIDFASELDNAEINLRYMVPQPLCCLSLSFLAGARFTRLNEQFGLVARQDGAALPTSAFAVRTENEMYGAQLGSQAYLPIVPGWWLDFHIKGALMQNNASQATVYTNSVGASFLTQESDQVTAFAGDLDLSVLFQPNRFISFTGGYMLLWLEGVALAPENLNRDLAVLRLGPAEVDHKGNTLFHGPHAGLTLSW